MTREHIIYHIKGMEMVLKYLIDALMCTFMDALARYVHELNGNMPLHFEDRMMFLEKYTVSAEMVKLMGEVKSQIFNTNDKELGEKSCTLDLFGRILSFYLTLQSLFSEHGLDGLNGWRVILDKIGTGGEYA